VDTLLQDNQQLSLISSALQPQRFKKIIYDFDLISGNVNLVSYQDGQPDAFYHFYEYDADNRIIAVYSSNYPQKNALININTVSNSPLWDNDAKYFYYAHGPLARTEYGDNKVQGMDYVYTLQGWIKGVNSNTLDTLRDIGKDGAIGSINSIFAKDAFGYTLNYHANDYKAIDGLKWNNANNRFESIIAGSDLNNSRNDLFNGNITSMVTTIEKPMIYTAAANQAPTVMAQGTAYKYDQLNRLKEMKAFANLDFSTNTWKSGSTYAGMYHNTFNYDANGNIQWQQRADSTGTIFDKLSYRYKLDPTGRLFQNRLYHVNDSVTNRKLVADDIDDEGRFAGSDSVSDYNNYRYDEIGNLKHDSQEEIDFITWTVYGKVKQIIRTDTSTKVDLEFNYDAYGNRISKIVKPHGSSVENGGTDIPTQWTTTYYVRDAEGKIMTTYILAAPAMASSFKVTERNMFGINRLGTDDSQIELIAALPTANPYMRTLGDKHYEASNHLGNVLSVFTDRKIPVTSNGTTIDHFDADVVNTYDYSPFGAPMNERTYRLVMKYTDSTHTTSVPAFVNGNEPLTNIAQDSLSYRYGFNGQEKINEIYGEGNYLDFLYRGYNPRLARFFAVDPLAFKYPMYTPYSFAANQPIHAHELEGLESSDDKNKTVEGPTTYAGTNPTASSKPTASSTKPKSGGTTATGTNTTVTGATTYNVTPKSNGKKPTTNGNSQSEEKSLWDVGDAFEVGGQVNEALTGENKVFGKLGWAKTFIDVTNKVNKGNYPGAVTDVVLQLGGGYTLAAKTVVQIVKTDYVQTGVGRIYYREMLYNMNEYNKTGDEKYAKNVGLYQNLIIESYNNIQQNKK
jgi:RHS repeat-associated protein